MKHTVILFSIVASLFFAACGNGWLDDIQPSDKGESSTSIKSVTDAQYALNGIYDLMRNYQYYGARYTYYGDVTGEDMQQKPGANDTKRCSKYYLFDLNDTTTPSSFWEYPYRVIRNANTIIEWADNLSAEEMNDEIKDILGQALTIRAMAHFDLVKIFGKPYTADNGASAGIPIEIEKHDPTSKPSRNTVAEVYAQVIKDLEDAAPLIGTKVKNGKLNWFGSQQVLARAYLYMDNNSKAYDTASNMITKAEAAGYKLWTNQEYAAIWSKDFTSEVLFELIVTGTETISKEGMGYLCWGWRENGAGPGYEDIALSDDYVELVGTDPDDVRNNVIKVYEGNHWTMKYPGNADQGENPEWADIIVLRMSEAYLIAAEAAVKNNDNTNALKYLNAIVKRANPVNEVTGTVTIDRVLEERRKELVGEGHRLFDALRNNRRIERKGASHNSSLLSPQTLSFDRTFDKTVMAIPKDEMNTNPNIIQNPGY